MSETALQRLSDYVESIGSKGRWLVLTHDNPDPDALAAAVVMTRVLRAVFRRRVTTAYGGIIGRAENQELVRLLKLKLRISHVRHLSWSHYRHFVLVDTQPRTGNNQLPEEIAPDLVIDHHPRRRENGGVPLSDIRPEYGASATIAAEYLLAAGIQPTTAEATAIVYAIRTETQDFGREASGPDRRVYDLVYPRANKKILARVQHPRLPLSYFRTLAHALSAIESVDNVVVCHLGSIDQPDTVAEMADLLLRLEGKTWSLCSGIYGDRIYLSIRTTNPRAQAGRLMRRLTGRTGRGGGHGMTAGGWVPTGPTPDRRRRQIVERFVRALKKSPDRIAPVELDSDP